MSRFGYSQSNDIDEIREIANTALALAKSNETAGIDDANVKSALNDQYKLIQVSDEANKIEMSGVDGRYVVTATSNIVDGNLTQGDGTKGIEDTNISANNVVQSSSNVVDNAIMTGDGSNKSIKATSILINDNGDMDGMRSISIQRDFETESGTALAVYDTNLDKNRYLITDAIGEGVLPRIIHRPSSTGYSDYYFEVEDDSGANPAVRYSIRKSDGTAVNTRPLFRIANVASAVLDINSNDITAYKPLKIGSINIDTVGNITSSGNIQCANLTDGSQTETMTNVIDGAQAGLTATQPADISDVVNGASNIVDGSKLIISTGSGEIGESDIIASSSSISLENITLKDPLINARRQIIAPSIETGSVNEYIIAGDDSGSNALLTQNFTVGPSSEVTSRPLISIQNDSTEVIEIDNDGTIDMHGANIINIGSNNVSTNSFARLPITISDNAIIRGNGIGRDLQTSTATIDDSGNLTCASLTVDGVLYNAGVTSYAGNLSMRVLSSVGEALIESYGSVRILYDSNNTSSEQLQIGSSAGDVCLMTEQIIDCKKPIILPSYATSSEPSTEVVAGTMIYDSTLNKLKFYNGTAWETVTSS